MRSSLDNFGHWEQVRHSLKNLSIASSVTAILAFTSASAWAQGSIVPLKLEPPSAEELVSPTKKPVEETITKPKGDAVQMDTLGAVDPESAGILSLGEGGYGIEMWTGTNRSLVERLLPQLPAETSSPQLRQMMRRLLLSISAPPVIAEGETPKGSLLTVRVEKLAAMGDLAGVADLLKVIPGHKDNQGLLRIEARSLFLANDLARACALASENLGEGDDPFWQKAYIFCQALAGEHDKASMGADLLQETGSEDPIFFELLDVIAGNSEPVLKSMVSPKPLYLAMARAAKVKLPTDAAWSSNSAVLKVIATSPNLPLEVRVDAAERAEASGALPTEQLRQIYKSVKFSKKDLASSLTKADEIRGAKGRALLYRSAIAQDIPTALAEVVQKALGLAREGGRYESGVRVFLPILKKMNAGDELVWFAPDAIRAFLSVGDVEAADAWFKLVRAGALFKADIKALYDDLMPLARIAGNQEAQNWGQTQLKAWWEKRRDKAEGRDKAQLLFVLLETFGDPIDQTLWQDLLSGPQKVSGVLQRPSLWFALESASNNVRVGETVALTAIGLGQGGSTVMEPMFLRHVLESLVRVGLLKDARALALEAAIAAGL
ncbi:MAG: hypothetical protein OQJ97_17085 [Rhodospirillales bacterium]|nr:hypothetical protein [Rhodospirillales bacterium]